MSGQWRAAWWLGLIAFVVAGFLGPEAARTEAPAANYQAGFLRTTVAYDPPFPVALWYPTTADEKPWAIGPYLVSATPDTPVATGRFPLILVSHGSGGSELGHHDWAETLARSGFIVAAPRHLGDSFDQPDGRGSDIQLIGRVWQIKKALDHLLLDPQISPSIDRDRIGVLGFSAGGYTALAAVGAKPDFDLWKTHCRKHPDDAEFCPSRLALLFSSPPRITRPGWELPHETRIKAAVVLAPPGILFDREGLADVTVPLRLYRAADDQVVRNAWNADVIIAGLPRKPETVTVPSGHFVFLAPTFDLAGTARPELYVDAPDIDRAAIHREIGVDLIDFFARELGR